MDEPRFNQIGRSYDFYRFEPKARDLKAGYIEAIRPAVQWCADQFGSDEAGAGWCYGMGAIYIEREMDAAAFKLRWC